MRATKIDFIFLFILLPNKTVKEKKYFFLTKLKYKFTINKVPSAY